MRTCAAIIATDQLNLKMLQTPASSLMWTMEKMIDEAAHAGISVGMPINVSHDKTMPIGWCVPQGVYVAKDMARQAALMHFGEDDRERDRIGFDVRRFNANVTRRGVAPHAEALLDRLAGFVPSDPPFRHAEAACVCQPGLAAAIYPEFFATGSSSVDKDGLVRYAELLSRTKQIAPGMFHEPEKDLLLFAHPYFRRSLSRDNSLNFYVLESFDEASKLPGLEARLRLDPDMLGLPASAGAAIELEYWGGPRFSEDIEVIPSGVTVHKHTDDERRLSRIDQTQIWWKSPETRIGEAGIKQFRTFEVEELIEDASAGLDGDRFGCRYAHAEYDLQSHAISHFDGAIRSYEGEAYLERLEKRIDRAGKQADYQKLFRLDGPLPVSNWKAVLTDFYRGNLLVPEYLGSGYKRPELEECSNEPQECVLPALSFYVGLNAASSDPQPLRGTMADQSVERDGGRMRIVENGPGKLGEILTAWTDRSRFAVAECSLPIANLSPVHLAGAAPSMREWVETANTLAEGLRLEASQGTLELASATVRWRWGLAEVSLSIAGKTFLVADLLDRAADLVDVGIRPSEWIERLHSAFLEIAPDLEAPVDWSGSSARIGRILVPVPDDTFIGLHHPLPPIIPEDSCTTDQEAARPAT